MGTPEIDLFAIKLSAVVPRYVSEDHKDITSEYTDAFSRPWNYKLAWIFPPPALIPRVLQHLHVSQGRYLLMVPKWEKAFWRAEVKESKWPSPQDPKSKRPSSGLTNQPTTPKQSELIFGGMEGTGWTNEIINWSEPERTLLQSAWTQSTLKTYRPAWRTWLRRITYFQKCPVLGTWPDT